MGVRKRLDPTQIPPISPLSAARMPVAINAPAGFVADSFHVREFTAGAGQPTPDHPGEKCGAVRLLSCSVKIAQEWRRGEILHCD